MKRFQLRTAGIMLMLALSPLSALQAQKSQGLALTPPMGWNSWNKFGGNVDERLIRETADAMAANGMKDAGYRFVVIDDCWQGKRDSLGFIRPIPERFPSGMKNIGDYIHSRGLKFGMYSCAGDRTCGGHPGSRGHEYQDALTYARWGVDYLKYDWCNTAGLNAIGAYTTMRDALFAAGRPVVFSLCEWGDNQPWLWGKDVGHLWRTTGDITSCFDCEVNHGSWSSWGVMKVVEMRKNIRPFAGPDHWNNPDMLEVGNGMPVNEDRAHFSLWCMLAAPLIAGNDIRAMSKETAAILTNREVIAIDQDSLGMQGFRYNDDAGGLEVWAKPLSHNNWALCFLNRSAGNCRIDIDWPQYAIADDLSKMALETGGFSRAGEKDKVITPFTVFCFVINHGGGIGLDDGFARKALDSVYSLLAAPHGIMLQQPAYSRYYLHLGEISSYPPGYKENAGIFCHNNPWVMIAETMVGNGDRAFDYYIRINPSAREHLARLHRCEPYVYAQMIAGKDAPTHGEAKNSWLTGTAAWNYVAVTQHILGIRPTYDGLMVAPVIPVQWKGFSVCRIFLGVRYTITVRRAGKGNHVRLTVDGRRVDGNIIPLPAAGVTMLAVDVLLE